MNEFPAHDGCGVSPFSNGLPLQHRPVLHMLQRNDPRVDDSTATRMSPTAQRPMHVAEYTAGDPVAQQRMIVLMPDHVVRRYEGRLCPTTRRYSS